MTSTPNPPQHTATFRFVVALDRYEPPRDYGTGTLEEFTWPDDGRVTYRLPDGLEVFREVTKAVFLIDDGRTVRPLYVTGWSGANNYVTLAPFPVNVHDDGTPRMRADDPARPVDYSTWSLGPSRAYHLKVTRTADKEG